MRRATRALLPLVVVALALSLAGCNLAPVQVLVPGFETAQVEGITFWRNVDGAFVVDGHLVFEEIQLRDGAEVLNYRIEALDGTTLVTSQTPVVRDPAVPDDVRLEVYYPRLGSEPAFFKVSTFNAAGESPLTTESRLI